VKKAADIFALMSLTAENGGKAMDSSYKYMKTGCAALAFHKSLIGLSQLDALEKVSGQSSDFYGARGIFVYYIVYHLFCACMLITPSEYVGKLDPPRKYGEVSDKELNSPSETPAQWENGKIYESDFATIIKHVQVKDFCARLRICEKEYWSKDAPYLVPLYRHFVDDTNSEERCIPGLYEKLCYVRDRVIYRPSYVQTASGQIVQTSAQLGYELRSLPNVKYLYHAITEIYDAIMQHMDKERQMGEYGSCVAMLTEMWAGRVNEEDLAGLCALGHSRRRLQRLGQREEDGQYSFPTYISHLLEIESIDFVRAYRKKYWVPLEKAYQDNWDQWRSTSKAALE